MLKVARINKLFGTDGGLVLTLYTDFPDDFDTSTPLFVKVDALDVPLYVERIEYRGQTGAVVRFDDIDSPRRAEEFLGKELFLAQEAASEQDEEFYMEDLIGFTVEADEIRGKITDYYDSEANPLIGIHFEGHNEETLVPAVEEFFLHIDFERCHVKMQLPDGLLEL